jgi:Leucine-rich repeat (LRR) protein
VKHIDSLKHLQELYLDENNLSSFSVSKALKKLHTLNLNYNAIQVLDVRNLPGLESLFADRNSIGEFIGLEQLVHIKVLSAECQSDQEMY